MSNMNELSISQQESFHMSTAEESEVRNEVLEKTPAAPTFAMPPATYYKAGRRHQLVFEGVCTGCAHCGHALTDAVSIERGIGPVCSKKGYLEESKQADEIQAMIDLSEYPALVDFIVTRYKPQGVRAMMNALVKICSLNRRSPVHPACCDAIDSLGYTNLASTLRESLAVVEIKPCPGQPDQYLVWVKRSDWHWGWTNAMRAIPGAYASPKLKGTVVPKVAKRAIWDAMLKFYEGLCAKTPTGTIKILPTNVAKQQATSDISPSQAATSN